MSARTLSPVDVAVVGGGPAGCAAATSFARRGARVALYDDPARTRRVGDGGAPGLDSLVEEIFGAGAFDRNAHRRVYGIGSAWGSSELRTNEFIGTGFGHGWSLDRDRFDADLREASRRHGVEVVAARVEPARRGREWMLTDAGGGRRVTTMVVDATGRRAQVARRCGAHRIKLDRLVGIEARWADGALRQPLIETTPDGWWYAAPLPGGTTVTIAFVDSHTAPAVRRTYRERLAMTRHAAVGGSRPLAKPRAMAAETSALDVCAGSSWLAVGDAGASFDPISGQGISAALLTGRAAPDGPQALSELRHDILAGSLRRHAAHYGDERRWLDRPFWACRR